jgi:hypothetical protein
LFKQQRKEERHNSSVAIVWITDNHHGYLNMRKQSKSNQHRAIMALINNYEQVMSVYKCISTSN